LNDFKNKWLYGKGLPNYSVYKLNNNEFLIKGSYKYPISALIDNKIVKIKPDTIIKANSIILDPFNRTLESDEWDNTYPRRIEFKPFFTIPKMGYYQISYIPFVFYNPFDNLFFGVYLNGSESYKRHFISFGSNNKGDFYLTLSENYFKAKMKYIKNIFNFEMGFKSKYLQIFGFNEYINDLSFLDKNYFEKINVWGFKTLLNYKNFSFNSKIARDFNKNENFIKIKLNYSQNLFERINFKLSYLRIFGNYPINERIYIDGGFYYPEFFEILLPYKGDWFYSKYIAFDYGIYSKRGENIFSDEFIFSDIKLNLLGFLGVYVSSGYTNKLYIDYGIYLKLFKLEIRFYNFRGVIMLFKGGF